MKNATTAPNATLAHLLNQGMVITSTSYGSIRLAVPSDLDGLLRMPQHGLQPIERVVFRTNEERFEFMNGDKIAYVCWGDNDPVNVISNFAVFADVGEF